MKPAPPPLIRHLLAGLPEARLIETHISWVILAGAHAYKLKKPLDLGFLDFSTLEKRRFCCEEEIRLNRRLAPQIYLQAVPVTGTPERPQLGGEGPVLEWAVKMRAFPAGATLDLAEHLGTDQMDAIAGRIADFHQAIARAPEDSPYGTPEHVHQPVQQNFTQLRTLRLPQAELNLLDRLQGRARMERVRLRPHFARRKAQGFIRECHGDLHLGNIAWVENAPLIFDGIEFNPGLRFIDVISEMAFLVMDLCHRQQDELAWRALNHYLEQTGDYPGLAALGYYLGYRALVRAKVEGIRARQDGGDLGACLDYLRLAERLTRPGAPGLILMHGVSGSGKTVLSQGLLQGLGAIRLRSDVERKRLFGLTALADSRAIPGGIYTPAAGERTREHLLDLSRQLLGEGFRVIVDATFLARGWREPFQTLAESSRVPWCLISPRVPTQVLRERVARRLRQGRDASEADLSVLEAQIQGQEPLSPVELRHTVFALPQWDRDMLLAQTLPHLRAS
ncbi:MAG TPA: AAA family ATPase [Thiobacillaceae bacterium]|nr:AAA family ATPase [Thiobacillaceae bacterium]HNU63544.1 AAA family ATPase [Thiobacillaceae bacterium]